MTPTTDQLADPDYWKKHAPEGAYCAWIGNSAPEVLAWSESATKGCDWWGEDGWLHNGFNPDCWRLIGQRPTQPQWNGEGLPPERMECEYRLADSENWFKCIVDRYVGTQGVVIKCDVFEGIQYCSFHGNQPIEFRPISTQAEIEREEVVEKAFNIIRLDEPPSVSLGKLYDAGMLRKPLGRWNFIQKVRDAAEKECGVTLSLPTLHSIADALGHKE